MSNNQVDVLVIGAGATGASVAYEASKRGLKVALIDAGDIGNGTSCRSTKLLHGGVRYLELAFKTFDLAQLKLVQEALIERSHWLEQAPFLAQRLELAIPSANYFDRTYFRIGLELYAALAGDKAIGTSRLVSKKDLHKAIPLLKSCSSGGVIYSDGQFNDARLNLLLALTAQKAGAILRTNCKVMELEKRNDGKICSVICQNEKGEYERWISNVIVNATGIHVDHLRQSIDSNIKPRILTSRGVHIVLEQNLCKEKIGLLLPKTDDGRVLFILPFFNRTLVGTTDSPCDINKAQVPSQQEKDYLINYLKRLFPSIKEPNITSCWAGGRPLLKPSKELKSSSRLIREHEVEILSCGLISAMGGKWTTCRPIALDVLEAIEKMMGCKLPNPKALPLIGTSADPKRTCSQLLKQRQALRQVLPETPFKESQLAHLEANYGLEAIQIIERTTPDQRLPLSEVIPLCEGEIHQAIHLEHARTPTDILARRCRIAMIDLDEAKRLLPLVQDHLKKANLPKAELNLER